jgi:hypothetical protein
MLILLYPYRHSVATVHHDFSERFDQKLKRVERDSIDGFSSSSSISSLAYHTSIALRSQLRKLTRLIRGYSATREAALTLPDSCDDLASFNFSSSPLDQRLLR